VEVGGGGNEPIRCYARRIRKKEKMEKRERKATGQKNKKSFLKLFSGRVINIISVERRSQKSHMIL
jgi:hypothetical protein